MDQKTQEKFDAYREELRRVYAEIPINNIYFNSRSSMDFTYEGADGKPVSRSVDPMVSSVVVSSVVPKSCVLYRGGHGGGKTSMIEEVTTRLFNVPKDEIVAAMIRGNDDQNVNTLLASLAMGKLLNEGEEQVRWRKFVTCPVKIIDEINRFPPTAQNALFEILNKGRVEFMNQVYEVSDFEVFATENPNDVGTYPMSRPFLDRFGLCIPAPQLPSIEDLMAMASRRDDKIYAFADPKKRMDIAEASKMEKAIANSISMGREALLYSIYLGQALETCERGDFGDKSHCELGLEERCKGCGFDTTESLCKMTQDGFSGRAFLDLQRWAKGYSFFLNAFKNPKNPEVQLSVVETLVPYLLYHRCGTNDSLFTKDPYFGRTLEYLKAVARKAREAYVTIKEPLMEIPDVLSGKVSPDKAKINGVKKDLVVKHHFLPIVQAAKLPEFRAIYDRIEQTATLDQDDLMNLQKTLTFGTELPPRAQTFLLSKAKMKAVGGETL